MESLKKSLFDEPVNSGAQRVAGAIRPCLTSFTGGSVCLTNTPAGPDRIRDIQP